MEYTEGKEKSLMLRAIELVAIGVFFFVLTRELTTTLITGTDVGSVVLQNGAALAIAAGITIAALLGLTKIRDRRQE